MSKFSYKTLFIIFFFLLIGVVVLSRFVLPKNKVSAAWWNDSWHYRKAISITNNTNYDATNIPYKINLDTQTLISNNKLQADADDIRIVDSDGKIVRHQVEKSTLNTANTKIWFEATVASNRTVSYYIYYGNSSVTAQAFDSDINTFNSTSTTTTIEMKDGFGYSTSKVNGGRISDIRKNSVDLGVDGNINYSSSYPGNWWSSSDLTQIVLNSSGPLFVEVNYGAGTTGSYSSYGTNIKIFDNGFAETQISVTYNTSGSENFYYYLSFTSGTRNSVWVDGSGNLVDQDADSGTLTESSLGQNWFGQRWTASGNYGGTIITKNGSDWVNGSTSTRASYFQTNYSYTTAFTSGSSREVRFGVFAGNGGLSEMQQKGANYGALGSTVASEEISPAPIAYWKFDEGSGTTAYDSVGDNNGTIIGATWTDESQCVSGKCLNFDGVNKLSVANNNKLDNTGPISISIWVKPTTVTGIISIINRSEFTGSDNGFSLEIQDGKPTVLVNNGRTADSVQKCNQTISTSTFSHLEWTRDNSNVNKIFINGKECTYSSTINTAQVSTSTTLGIGSKLNKQNIAPYIDYSNRTYNSPYTASSWGGDAATITYYSNGGYGNLPYKVLDKGSSGTGGSFLDDNSVITIVDNQTYVISAWMKASQNVTLNAYSLCINRTADNAYRTGGSINLTTNWQKMFWVYSAGVGHSGSYASRHIIYDDTGLPLDIYWSGFTVENVTGTGKTNPTLDFTGLIDEVKIYNYARTATQIKQDYNSRGSSKGSSVNLGVKSNTVPSLKSKLVAYYKFDEGNGSTINNSGNGGIGLSGVLGTGNSTPTWTNNGKFNKALSFNGSTNYLTTSSSTSLYPGKVSFFSWVYPQAYANGVDYSIKDDNSYFFVLTGTGTQLSVQANLLISGTWRGRWSATKTIDPNKWSYVGFTYDGSLISFYVNGELSGSFTPAVIGDLTVSSSPIIIGRRSSGSFFNGLIDEVKIYNTALTADEVKQDYNSGVATQFGATNQTIGGTTTDLNYCIPGDTSYCASPIAEWNLEENTGTIAKDISGNNNTGTINNPTWTAGPKGKGSALSLNGTNVMIGVDHNPVFNFGTGDFTIEFWLNYKGPTVINNTYGVLVAKETGAGSSNPGFTSAISTYGGNGSNYGVLFSTTNGAWGTGNVEHTGSYLPNNWYHVVGVRSGTTFTVYKNGQYGTSRTAAGIGVDVNNTTFLKIGGRSPWGYVNGSMDDIKIYNYARTPAQIAYDYNKGAPIAHWKLDECQGLTSFDASGLGNTGTISIGSGGSQNSIGTCQIGTSAAWTNGASGKINGSLNFDGIDDRITFSNNIFPSTMNEFSVSVWVYQKSYGTSGSSRPYISNWNTWSVGSQKGFLLRSYDTLNYPSFIVCDGTNYYSVNSTPIIPLNTWTHLVGVFKGGSILKIYMNGKEAGNSGSIPSQFVKEPTSLYMGYSGINTGYMDGQIDDARIYNYALTPEQVKTVYNNGAINFQ